MAITVEMSRRRCELEQAIIRAMILGDRAWANTIGEQDWEIEKGFHMEEDTMHDLNYYRDLCYEANRKWWIDLDKHCHCVMDCATEFPGETPIPRPDCQDCHGTGHPSKDQPTGEKLILCISELSEALEGHRKSLMDDKLPHRKMVEVELVDFLIRAFGLAGGKGWSLTAQDVNPLTGTFLDEIATKIPTTIVPLTFSDELMKITGFLVDCFRYKDFQERQARNLAYAVHTALALMSYMKMDIQGAFDEKIAYNAHREDHKPENRVKEGGKKF